MRKKDIKDVDNVPNIDQILLMDESEIKEIIIDLRKKYSIKTLCKYWGVSSGYIYNKLIYKYDIKTKPLIKKDSKIIHNKPEDTKGFQNNTIDNKSIESINPTYNEDNSNVVVYVPEELSHSINSEGIKFSFNGTCNGQALDLKLKKFANMLEEGSNYKVKFMLEEI